MKIFAAIFVTCLAGQALATENYVREDNLSPNEAQQYLERQSMDLRYADFLGEHPIPYQRSGEAPRQYWYNGRRIENPSEFVEEEYLANQFHGQDGLGRALFGYTDHNQARVEAINGNGDVRGSYKYLSNGDEIEVKYWADSLGFHHTDNIPKVELQPVTETPAVRQAREEHERAWKEAAAAAAGNSDPMSDYYNRFAIASDETRSRVEQQQELMSSVSNQNQGLTRYPTLPYTQHINSNTKIKGQHSTRDSVIVNAQGRAYDDGQWHPENEGQGEPHGFFYSFDYPVSLIVPVNARSLNRPGQKY